MTLAATRRSLAYLRREAPRAAPAPRASLLLVVALLAVACAGCGGSGEGGSGGELQVLRVNYGAEPPTLDPALVTDVLSANVLNALMDPLVKLGRDLEPVPALARSWQVSADGTTITFRLRRDGRWTNGDPVTARDFEYSWKRVLTHELASAAAYRLFGIAGAQAFNACKRDCAALRDRVGVNAADDWTLEVELARAQPWFVEQTATATFLAVHEGAVEEHGEKWTEPKNIVTNGPFRLAAWAHGSSITLERWALWRDAASVELDRVEGRMIADATTALQAFEAGELDACTDRETCIPAAEIGRLAKTAAYVRRPALATQFVAINVENVPDVDQRRALAFALDRRSVIENLTRAGEAPATSLTPEGMPGYEVIRQSFLPTEADLAAAKRYLARVATPKLRINLLTGNDSAGKDAAVAIQDMWADLGIETRIRSVEWAQFLAAIGPPPGDDVDAVWIGWVGDYPDDMSFLEFLTCKSGLNFTQLCDAGYDRLIEAASRTRDAGKRHELYAVAEARLTGPGGALAVIPVFWNTWAILRKDHVRGWEPNPLAQFDYTKVSLERQR